jgi:hypothetical protein
LEKIPSKPRTTEKVILMLYFIISIIFVIGFGLIISGSQTLTKEVRTNMAPEDIELIMEELAVRKQVGQLILLSVAIILIFYLT